VRGSFSVCHSPFRGSDRLIYKRTPKPLSLLRNSLPTQENHHARKGTEVGNDSIPLNDGKKNLATAQERPLRGDDDWSRDSVERPRIQRTGSPSAGRRVKSRGLFRRLTTRSFAHLIGRFFKNRATIGGPPRSFPTPDRRFSKPSFLPHHRPFYNLVSLRSRNGFGHRRSASPVRSKGNATSRPDLFRRADSVGRHHRPCWRVDFEFRIGAIRSAGRTLPDPRSSD